MIQTFIGYGYNLGGPGRWHLTGIDPGTPLRTPRYDETDPTHDFPDTRSTRSSAVLPASS